MANVSEHDHELLSAYVDGMLDEQERLTLETRLHSDADLLRALTALYLTLAMVKQLPTLTAPRNFTLKDPPARWLVFPTTPVFSALSAAAATFLVVIGFFLLTTSMNAGISAPPAPQAASQPSDEVALITNQTSQSTNPPPTMSTTQEALRDMQTAQETATVTTLLFSATQSSNYIVPPSSGGAGGGIPTGGAIDTFSAPETPTFETMQIEPEADGADSDDAAANTGMIQPLSTGTPMPTLSVGTLMPTMSIADAAPAQNDAAEEAASDTAEDTSSRYFTPSEQPVPSEDGESAEDIVAQEPTPTATPRPTQPPTATLSSTMTVEAPVTLAPTLVPVTPQSQRAMTPLLGIGLVVGGALLFGIAFMTAVTRRGDRRRSRKDE